MRSSFHIVSLLLLFGYCSGCANSRSDTGTLINREGTLLEWKHKVKEKDDAKPEAGDADKTESGPKPKPDRRTEEPLASDRPDFTEASSTVGRDRIQLESGYTYTRDKADGITTKSHSYPEMLLRVGLWADWFELRVGQNFGNSLSDTFGAGGSNGGEDLYLGVKLGLTEQSGLFPESALIIQSTVPTGHRDFTSGVVQPGFNYLFGWDVIPDKLTFAGSLAANAARDDLDHGYMEWAQSFTVGYGLTDKLGAYTEWFAFYPVGAIAPGVGAQHYFNGGFFYRVTPNLQLDVRAGLGLSKSADDFFAGSGFVFRY